MPSTPPRATVLLITGSGRSGTSSIAGTFKRLGLHIPQPEIEADERNPLGYYEPKWVADFHKLFLNAIPVRTIDSRPDAGEVAMSEVSPALEGELRDWLEAEVEPLPDGTVIVIKETRAYWVYPMWQRVCSDLGLDLKSLTMVRHPTQVVRSRDSAYLTSETEHFRRRREATNVAAWMNSIYETERATRGNPRAFVAYTELLSDWRMSITQACAQLGIDPGDLSAPHAVDIFLTTALNRSADVWEGLDVPPLLIDMAERTWSVSVDLIAAPEDAGVRQEMDALRREYVDLFELSAAVAHDETLARMAFVRNKLKKRLGVKQERLDKLRVEVHRLRARKSR